jgi:thiol-disulfide isomerase/thioredoxin
MRTQLIFYALLLASITYGQPTRPTVGQSVPEFWLSDVHHYSKRTIGPGDLKGKWAILDFWSKGCTACVKSFPKLNELQREFKNEVQFVLVGINDKYNKNIELVYERFRQKLGLNLTIAYDSILPRQFGVTAVPHVVILDPESNVYSVTYSDFLQKDNIENMIHKGPSAAIRETSQRGKLWEFWTPDTANNNRMLYRSILSNYAGEALTSSAAIGDDVNKGMFQTVHLTLAGLYFAAFDWYSLPSQSRWEHPIFEINDSSQFQFDTYSYKGLYNYSVSVPANTKQRIMNVMQADLKKYFGYEILIEKRAMPYWRLTASKTAIKHLASTSGDYYFAGEPIGVVGRKITIANVLDVIRQYSQQPLPFIDETGISEQIDINFNAVMTDLDDVRKSLARHGLQLEVSHKQMTVLVIRDPQPGSSGY